MTDFFAERAFLGDPTPAHDVTITVSGDRITAVSPDSICPEGAHRLPGLTLPGFVNGHSHVFHRAIRGHGQHGVDSFWAWRDMMYALAERLDPDSLYELALCTFAEMALAGVTSVGEFFYLHHQGGGQAYADPNEMGKSVCRAAIDAGLRITLLDTVYLQGGVDGRELVGVQQRFSDGSWQAWAERVAALPSTALSRPGAAIHSVRAVPTEAFAPIAEFARSRSWPIHAHVSEQPLENAETAEVFGATPTELLDRGGVLGTDFTSVHATHLSDRDITRTGTSGSTVCMCCTTERDLADGVGEAGRLVAAGADLSVGSDAHMIIDLLEEARAIETDLRLVTNRRGHLQLTDLVAAVTSGGADSLGWDAGRIEPGRLADLTTVALDTPRTAGSRAGDPLAQVIFGAQASDVHSVVRGGQLIVSEHQHRLVSDLGPRLDRIITDLIRP